MKRGETYTGEVRLFTSPDKGIACVEESEVLIRGTLPGQEVSFILSKNKAGLREGRLLEIKRRSETETIKGCSVCGRDDIRYRCGGCIFQTIPYEEELKLKDSTVREILGKALKQHGYDGERFDSLYEGITGSPEISGYRNKMEFSFGNAVKDGPLTLGMHVAGHFMDVLDTPDCNIVDEDFRKIREYCKVYALKKGLGFYHRGSNSGYLRNLLIRKGINTGEILVDLVTTSGGEADEEEFTKGLLELSLDGSLVGILHTQNDAPADAVVNEKTTVLYGRDHVYDELLGLRFKISAFSFFQTNTRGAEVLYTRVRDYVSFAGREASGVVYDLYSGTGTIAQIVSDTASSVYGIEIVSEAVEAAVKNAEANGIGNTHFICGDVLQALDEIEAKPDLIILDPPRGGVNPKALKKILDYGVEYIIYISCKIASLARDLHLRSEEGYEPVRLSAVDMFPRTSGIEGIALFRRNGGKSYEM